MKINLRIKGTKLWRLCACTGLAIVITCCTVSISKVDQPDTATVGSTIPITLHGGITSIFAIPPYNDYYIFCFLAPKGWKAAENITVTYTSNKGNGRMRQLDANALEPQSRKPWPVALKDKFGIGANLIDDMEWTAYKAENPVPFSNGDNALGDVNILLKVGADNNNTYVKLGYVICGFVDGLSDGLGAGFEYNFYSTPCMAVTGGTGDLIDFCNPKISNIDPPKSSDNDYLTVSFDGNIQTTVLEGDPEVYLCSTAHVVDVNTGAVTAVTVCGDQTGKSTLKQDGSSNKYSLTFWPRSYYNLTVSQAITSIDYYITDKSGTEKKVGYNNGTEAFVYNFKCIL